MEAIRRATLRAALSRVRSSCPDSGLPGVIRDEGMESLVVDLETGFSQSIPQKNSRQEMRPGDFQLFRFCVAREFDHFEPVEERAGNTLDEIGRRHEKRTRPRKDRKAHRGNGR